MTKIAATSINGKIFIKTSTLMVLKLGMEHQELKFYKVYIFNLTFSIGMSNPMCFYVENFGNYMYLQQIKVNVI